MKLTTAENINLAEGKSDVILFCERLIECGLFKSGTILPTGFGLRLRRASRGRILRYWIFQYRQHGRTRRMIIGSAHTVTPVQALERARKLHAKVELGGDPQAKKAERREQRLTFWIGRGKIHEHADPPNLIGLLRACDKRPRYSAAEQRG